VNEEQRSPGGGAVGPVGWLAGLLGLNKRDGRLKGDTLKRLVWFGLFVLLGVAAMGIGDILKPSSPAAYDGTTAGSSADGAGATGQNAGSALAAGGGSSGIWISVSDLEAMMERTLERILSQIRGAGKVSVAVSLETGATYVYGYDETQTSQTTQEHDASGGSRVVTETNSTRSAVVVSQSGSSQAVVVRVDLPPVKGVVVVATGAGDSRVKALLSAAVQTLYGVPAYRVIVLAGG